MPCEVTPARADGAAHRRLQSPRLDADQEQVGDVRRGNEQDHAHGGKENPERLRHQCTDDVIAQRLDARGESGSLHHLRRVDAGECLRKAASQRGQLTLGIGDTDAGPKAANRVEDVITDRGSRRIHTLRQPQVHFQVGKLCASRQHANHSHGVALEVDLFADDGGIAAVPPFPQAMAHQRHVERVQRPHVVVGIEKPPALRHDAKNAKEARAHICHGHALRLMRAPVTRNRSHIGPINAEILEQVAPLPEVEHLVSREAPDWGRLDPRHRRGERDEPVAVRIRQRPQHDGVENREDRRRRAEA